MKITKILAAILALALSLSAVACTTTPDDSSSPESTPAGSPAESTPSASAPESSDEIDYPEMPKIDYMSLDLSQYLTLGQYKELSIAVTPKVTVDEAYIDEIIKSDLLYYGQTEKVTDRAVTKEDTVSISFVGYHNGVAFEGGTGDKDNFTIYDGGGFIDGFADGLIGAMPGTEVDVNVTFPKEYHSPELAGQPAVFKVTVHHIYEPKKLTDEVADAMTNGQYKTAAELVEYYREYLTEYEDSVYEEAKLDLTWKKIFDGVTNVNIPDEMVNEIYDYQIWWVTYYAEMYGMDIDTYLSYDGYTRESLREESYNNIFCNMVVYSIIKAENITLTAEEYNKFLKDNDYKEEDLLKEYSRDELEDLIIYTITYEKAVTWQTFTDAEPGNEPEGKTEG